MTEASRRMSREHAQVTSKVRPEPDTAGQNSGKELGQRHHQALLWPYTLFVATRSSQSSVHTG